MTSLSRLSPLPLARAALLACAVGLLLSPPFANLMQGLLLLLFLFSSELRGRLREACRQPMVLGALALLLMVTIAAGYSVAPPAEAFGALSSWRKVLLVPAAAALYDDARAKHRLAFGFVVATCAIALVSYASFFSGRMLIPVPASEPAGIVARNHVTQGMLFAVAAFTAATVLLSRAAASTRDKAVLAGCAVLLTLNVLFVSTGRSGYVVLLACAAAGALAYVIRHREQRLRAALIGGLCLLALALLLVASPRSREGIEKGLRESQTFEQQTEITSMGVRMRFWRNSLALIAERPVFGHGTASFERIYADLVRGRPGVAGLVTVDPHQQFLKIFAEQGLVGLVVFLAFLGSTLRQAATPPWRLLGLGVLGAWTVTSLANSHFTTFNEGTFLYLWIGAMLAAEHTRRQEAAVSGVPAAV